MPGSSGSSKFVRGVHARHSARLAATYKIPANCPGVIWRDYWTQVRKRVNQKGVTGSTLWTHL